MRRTIVIFSVIVITIAVPFPAIASENFPAIRQTATQAQEPHPSEVQQKLFYGYVPPPPIQHSWPGGFRVLVHEVINTLMDHMTGRY
ncbi:MAG: hypothetical protein WCG29_08215 [Desulfomonile sp.]|jgi:hypothetical protein